MRLIGVATVRNESDIIESFVRHNLRFLDRLHIVDNGSTDSTGVILSELTKTLPALTVEQDPYQDHSQERKLTAVARAMVGGDGFDFLLPLDADEFLRCPSRDAFEAALGRLPPGTCGALLWVTFVPTPGDDLNEPDPIRRIVHRRVYEPTPMVKVVIPHAIMSGGDCWLQAGNHAVAARDGRVLPQVPLDGVTLAHFPVRSPEQFASKILLGEWALRMKIGRGRSEGYHWRALAAEIERNPALTQTRLSEIAASYAARAPADLIRDPLPVAPSHALSHGDRIEVDLLRRVVSFAGRHFADLAHRVYANRFMVVACTYTGVLGYHRADTVIGRSLAMYGEWARKKIELLLALLQPGYVVVDVGANIGTHAVRFAQRVGPQGIVHAFEAQRLVFQMLCANVALNGLVNVHAHHLLVGDAEGMVPVPAVDLSPSGNVGSFSVEKSSGGELVRQVTLDKLGLPSVHLIKADVKGMEERVLRGATLLIERDRPFLFVGNNVPERSASLLQEIEALGYRCWWHFDSYYTGDNYYGNRSNIFAHMSRPEINILSMPEGASIEHPSLVPVRAVSQSWEEAYAQSQSRPLVATTNVAPIIKKV